MFYANNKSTVKKILIISLVLIILLFFTGFIKTNIYNSTERTYLANGAELFTDKEKDGVYVNANARDDTWYKSFDLNNEGITDLNYQAYTYDFTVYNNSQDSINEFEFKVTFSELCFLSSAWNGSLEIHQHANGQEIVDTVEDLRVYKPQDHNLEYVVFDGDSLIRMDEGDYLIYHPSTSINAVEAPLDAYKATTPGIILYVEIGKTIENSTLELTYKFHRLLLSEPLIYISAVGLLIWVIALIFIKAMDAQYRIYQRQHDHDNQMIEEAIDTFVGFIDAKDPYTHGHSKRVALYTRMIAEEMGYKDEELNRIYYIALLHDCGKIGVPDSVLEKPGRLTDEEFEIIKSHASKGNEVLQSFKSIEGVADGAHYHHERYDGRGYPEGLKGEDIPLIARMICVADSFDAMNSNRVYRDKLSKEKIVSEIETNKGKQFDPQIADVMLKLINEGKVKI